MSIFAVGRTNEMENQVRPRLLAHARNLLPQAVSAVLTIALLVPGARAQTLTPPNPPAQTDGSYEARKQQAIALYRQNRMTEAMPLLEKLHDEKPTDAAVLGLLSFTVLANSATFSDSEMRKKERARARKLAVEAQAAGDNSNLTKAVLDIPEDGSEIVFSDRAAVQSAMDEGEAAFAKGNFDAAVAAYSRALALDPKQYHAALFLGDVYFKRGDHEQSMHWFARAIEIDPNQETAYRYWGDDLVAQGRWDDARDKFIDAIVAEPYRRSSWVGLSQWAPKQKLTLAFPQINPKGKIEDKGEKHTNITIDPSMLNENAKKDGTNAWFIYTLARATWHGEKFQNEFPQEKAYRHTLREEVDGLQAVVRQVKEGLAKKEIKHLDPGLAALVKLANEGLLESYVLISRPDEGIGKDYPAYRDAHRDKLHQYIAVWGIHPQP